MTDERFRSSMAEHLSKFLEEKRAVGYRYFSEERVLRAFDRYLQGVQLTTGGLPQSVVDGWVAKRLHETAVTQRNRAGVVKEFARFLIRRGVEAHVPDTRGCSLANRSFTPRIFTVAEVAAIVRLTAALPVDPRSPLRHIVLPEVFGVLYGCGLRCGEALRLSVRDVDLEDGIFTVYQGKFLKDRLAPMSPSLLDRLRKYTQHLGRRDGLATFFPAPHGGVYTTQTVYATFRRVLRSLGIPHGGRGRGPRVHDLRHTFAVHRLEQWYREGVDLGAKLPVLSTYMGHQTIYGTQRYLRLTAELYPDIAERMQAVVGAHIPKLSPG